MYRLYQDKADALCILERCVQADDVLMLQARMQLDLPLDLQDL
jgi:hypothetical protein